MIVVKLYRLIDRAVEEGIAYGYTRAYKHGKPSEQGFKEQLQIAVMNEICEVIDFEKEESHE